MKKNLVVIACTALIVSGSVIADPRTLSSRDQLKIMELLKPHLDAADRELALWDSLPPPTEEQIKGADYGKPMSSETCISVTENAIKSMLKDPSLALFEHTKPCSKGHVKELRDVGPYNWIFGYIQKGTVNVDVNAKSKFHNGSYMSLRKYTVLIKNGVVVYCSVCGGHLSTNQR